MSSEDHFTKATTFERAVRRLLRPLLRALIAKGVTAPTFYRIVKQSYVDVAISELGDYATDSRVSILTGVHRRDVKTFRNIDADVEPDPGRRASILSTVIGRWLSHPDYQDDTGAARALPRQSENDGAPSFDALVQSVSRDIRPRAVLDELERQGAVRVEDGQVLLKAEGLIGSADAEQKLHFFAANLGDHMNAAVENLISENPEHLERAVFYNHLSENSVAHLETRARELGLETLQELNTLASERQEQEKNTPDATHRFRFGLFFYKEDERDQDQ
ncbi:MAG: DUF6502 family protein [Litoreibacter sp.]|nr:DUF6502 family protein [Litoreibacter sp.]